jgi:hypothetical protein
MLLLEPIARFGEIKNNSDENAQAAHVFQNFQKFPVAQEKQATPSRVPI